MDSTDNVSQSRQTSSVNVIQQPLPTIASQLQHGDRLHEPSGATGCNSAFVPMMNRTLSTNAAGGMTVSVQNLHDAEIGAEFVSADEVNSAADIMRRTVRLALRGMQRNEGILDGPTERLFPALKSQITLHDKYRHRVYDCLDKLEPLLSYAESARLESNTVNYDD